MTDIVTLICAACSVGFSMSPAELARRERRNGGPVKYCCRACVGAGRRAETAERRKLEVSKVCATCEQDLPIEMFSMKTSKTGLRQNSCKKCSADYAAALREAEPEKQRAAVMAAHWKYRDVRLEKQRRRYKETREEVNQERRARRPELKDSLNLANKLWRQANPELVKALDATKRANRRRGAVSWDKELTDLVVLEAADLVAKRASSLGGDWHIDHAIPLQGKNVCGLHVWNNLAVVPAAFNLSKGNKFGPEWTKRSWL